MYKILISLLAIIVSSSVSMAQSFAGATVQSAPNARMEILQVDNREFSTLVFMSYTTPDVDNWSDDASWMNFGDKTYIQVPGSNKKYPMISTINMPINSEAENKCMMFDRRNQRHQFVLEFERIPEKYRF